jgi:hypothetical protein
MKNDNAKIESVSMAKRETRRQSHIMAGQPQNHAQQKPELKIQNEN